MGVALETIADGMGVVVERVDAPPIAHMRVRMELYAVDNWVAKSSIGVLVVNLCAQRVGSFFVKTEPHLFKQSQVFLNGSIAILRRQSFSSLLPHLLSRL